MVRYAEDMTVDKKDQLEKIEGVCLPNEMIRAVFDMKGGGTGFIGLTDRRGFVCPMSLSGQSLTSKGVAPALLALPISASSTTTRLS